MIPRDFHSAAKNGGAGWFELAVTDRISEAFPNAYPLIAVYHALCSIAAEESRAKRQNVCRFRAGLSRIMAKAGCSRSSAIRWLAQLESGKFIEVAHAPQSKNNDLPNEYTLVAGWSVDKQRATDSVPQTLGGSV